MARRSLLLGIEGGVNRSVGILADDAGTILAKYEGAPINFPVKSVDQIAQAVFTVMTRCSDDARCKPSDLSVVVLGTSGFERQIEQARLREAVNSSFVKSGGKPVPISIESEARIALEGAFDGGPGIVIVAGTGSIVVGKTQRGELISIGGWGRILGDEGSGYFIGREALVAVAHECEHRGTAGELREVFGDRFHFDSRESILAAVYQDRFDIAALAPVVMETAARNDLIAQRILDRAATLLADQARTIVMKMGLLRKVRLTMVGSLVEGNTIYANALHMKLLRVVPQVEIQAPLHEPAYGAMLLAAGRLRKT